MGKTRSTRLRKLSPNGSPATRNGRHHGDGLPGEVPVPEPPRTYEPPLKVFGTFDDVLNVAMSDEPTRKPKKG